MEIRKMGLMHQKQFQQMLALNLRQFFCQKKGFSKVFDEVNKVNALASELINQLSSYKYELSQTLQEVTLCFNQVFEHLLEQCYQVSEDTQEQVQAKIKEQALTEKEFQK